MVQLYTNLECGDQRRYHFLHFYPCQMLTDADPSAVREAEGSPVHFSPLLFTGFEPSFWSEGVCVGPEDGRIACYEEFGD